MAVAESGQALKAGDPAPDFELKGTDGRMHRLSSYGARGYLVVFMCNHCPYVKAKADALNGLHARFGGEIAMVGVNSNDASRYPDDGYEAMVEVAREKGFRFDYLVDETQEVARAYGATCTPDPFLFDSERRLVFHGRIDDAMKPGDTATTETMAANIEAMLAGRPIEKDFDPSIGCSIKWKG